ncbi:MAG: energy-coupling factor transport system substrate-specific component [Solirubrobacteraceae bacterium]|nr:energy-coupling factor transport system substrate-specific component [Solirubrobacteraceae bacterium]
MSWQLASFSILALALAAGFAWYERAHPSARTLALVATMAALAALGRVAFAPLPNVKPTTDIVLIAGVALGGAPGFAVGALAALTSNLFFGQGPWTPWQMAAWGGVGIAGALLGRVAGRRLGRIPLAAACALAGLAFGAVMNFSTWVTYTGDHSLAAYGTIAATAVPFDVAHAVGNVLFALAFGPALLRALERYRARLDFTWRPAPAATLALAALAAALVLVAPAAAATPASYLRGAQNADGGWGGAAGQPSAQLYTGWAALGLAASGANPGDVRRGGKSPLDFMRAHAAELNDTGELERTILVLAASGASTRSFAGRDLVAALESRRRADGSFAGGTVLTAFSVMALRAAGRGGTAASVRWLERQQNSDGGWSVGGRGIQSTVDDTASVVEGLVAGGRRGARSVRRGAAFLTRVQNPDGGFALNVGDASNAQSTAYVVQALLAAGRNPDRVHRAGSRSPLAYLRSLTQSNGLVRFSRTSTQTSVWVTGQAAMALARKPLPLARVPRKAGGAAATGTAAPGAAGAPGAAPASGSAAGVSPSLLVAARTAGMAFGLLLAPLAGGPPAP